MTIKRWLIVGLVAYIAFAAFSIRGCMVSREESARERARLSGECAGRGGHYHCPYRADCLCLAPGMVVP